MRKLDYRVVFRVHPDSRHPNRPRTVATVVAAVDRSDARALAAARVDELYGLPVAPFDAISVELA